MSLGFWLIRGSALGPIGGLSTRQFNSCLPRIVDEDEDDDDNDANDDNDDDDDLSHYCQQNDWHADLIIIRKFCKLVGLSYRKC